MQGVAVWLVRRPRVWAGIALVGSFAEVGLLGVALGTVYNKRECFFSVFLSSWLFLGISLFVCFSTLFPEPKKKDMKRNEARMKRRKPLL